LFRKQEKSTFAALSPSIITDGVIYVALKCYCDGSEKIRRQLTLAAVAGDETVWGELEEDWRSFLAHIGIPYTHMKEAIARKDVFRGWPKDKRDWFINGLITFFHAHEYHSKRLRAFTSSVDLKAHAEFSHIPGLPDPARMCVRHIVPEVFKWYCGFPDKIIDVMEFYFDRGERFMSHIWDDWNSEEFRTHHPMWGMIRTIAPVDMKLTPGIQVADMFAWARTHVDRQRSNSRFWGPALMLCHPSNAEHRIFDRAKIQTYPPYAIM
jgi:hypothetical protein